MEKGNKFTINLVKKTSAITAALACIGSFLIFLLFDQPIQQSYIALFSCAILCSHALYVRRFPYHKYNSLAFILIIMLAVIVPLSVSGGVHSRFATIIPVLPMMMFLMLTKKQSYSLTLFLIIYIICISLFSEKLVDLTANSNAAVETFPKALWLLIAIILSFVFTAVFADINAKLTIQLHSTNPNRQESIISDIETALNYASNLRLKMKASVNGSNLLAVFVAQPYLLASDKEIDESQAHKLRSALRKVFRRETDILGKLDDERYLICHELHKKEDALQKAQALQQQIKYSDTSFYIGFIVVEPKIGIDIHSIIKLADMAMHKVCLILSTTT